jgi:hypothetical protein
MVARRRRSVVTAIAVAVALAIGAIVSFGAMPRSGAAVDTDAPVLASLGMTPTAVDTSNGPAVVTITARLTDARSPSIGGTAPLSRVLLTGPGGQQQSTAYLSQAQRISASPTAHGYWFVAGDGGIFGFGDARFFGSLAGTPAPVVGMVVRTS